MLVVDRHYDTVEINKVVKRLWDSKELDIEYKPQDSENKAFVFKSGFTIPIEELHNPPSHESIAEKLVEQMEQMMRNVSDGRFTAYVTTESIVSSIIHDDFPKIDNFTTAYYTGNTHVNPPEITAWMVMRGTFPNAGEPKEVIMMDGEIKKYPISN